MSVERTGMEMHEMTFPPIEGKLILVLDLVEGVDAEDLATNINTEILFRLENDDKKIANWEWIY